MLAGALNGVPAQSYAQGEHARRAGAELAVLIGDIRRLQDKRFTALQQRGLRQRILGGLAGLDLLLRLADQERQKEPQSYSATVTGLIANFRSGDVGALRTKLNKLATRAPLQIRSRPDKAPGTNQLEETKKLHGRLCAACHDKPVLDTERPAYNLFDEAARLKPVEFFARMLVGVRGDSVTGIDNPLSDQQIRGLVEYYRTNGKPDH